MTHRLMCPACKNNDSEGFRIHYGDCAMPAYGGHAMSIELECNKCNHLLVHSDDYTQLAKDVGFVDAKSNLIEKDFPEVYRLALYFLWKIGEKK